MQTGPPLASALQRLLQEPHRSSFMQAVRLLELHWTQRGLGSHEIFTQRLQFGNSLSLAFPPSELAEFSTTSDPVPPDRFTDTDDTSTASTASTTSTTSTIEAPAGADRPAAGAPTASAPSPAAVDRARLVPAFMGLLGANGNLPAFYTELLAEREAQHRDRSARAFLDIFQQRAVSLFYAAWRKSRLPLRFELNRRDEFLPLPMALAGLGLRPLHDRLAPRQGGVADDTLAYFSGHLQRRTPSAASLRQMLAEYFGVPVKLESFVGRWFELPATQQTALGLGAASLGRSAVAGERVWQRDLRVRLNLGPLRREQFHRFLPGGTAQRALRELLLLLTGGTLEYEVRLTLAAQDVSPAQLNADSGPRLGWDGFLVTETAPADRCDAGYDLAALA
jgi:type VI secretion system protein ImpH